MTSVGGGKYSANIPAQNANTTVNYLVLAKTSAGYLPYFNNAFHVGPDLIPPVIAMADTIRNSINVGGPFALSTTVTDNLGVDTSSVFVRYSVNGGTESQAQLARTYPSSVYSGAISFGGNLTSGEVVTYYVSAADRSVAKNPARYPPNRNLSFVVGKQLIDDFENGLNTHWAYGSWGFSNQNHVINEKAAITDSPTGNYAPNSDNILQRLTPYDFSQHSGVELRFYQKIFVDPSDTFYIEASKEGSAWTVLSARNGIDPLQGFPTKQSVFLNDFSGAGAQNVQIRFRLHSDASVEADGVYLDDIELYTDGLTSGVVQVAQSLPTRYSLSQNYPNPFNPSTTIEYAIPKTSEVTLMLYDLLGRRVTLFYEGLRQPGVYHVNVEASSLATGIYYYRLTAGIFTGIKKMLLLK